MKTPGQILFEAENPFPNARSWDECHPKVKALHENIAQAVLAAASEKGEWVEKCAEECRDAAYCSEYPCDAPVFESIIRQHAPALGGWVKCSERLPDDSEIQRNNGRFYCWIEPLSLGDESGHLGREDFCVLFNGRWVKPQYYQVTHWMPLPPMPEGK